MRPCSQATYIICLLIARSPVGLRLPSWWGGCRYSGSIIGLVHPPIKQRVPSAWRRHAPGATMSRGSLLIGPPRSKLSMRQRHVLRSSGIMVRRRALALPRSANVGYRHGRSVTLVASSVIVLGPARLRGFFYTDCGAGVAAIKRRHDKPVRQSAPQPRTEQRREYRSFRVT